ncbi:MFS transporter [Euzebya sp.]|uniref:MFS transporter n=1 Tax=Euzebya sp. TaxID=1971409 RepID=UPI003510E884
MSATGVDAGPAAAHAPARSTTGLLSDRVFGAYFFGKLLSTAGVWVFNIVAAIIVWDISRSTLAVGAVSIALFLPQVAFAPISGAQADRRGPKGQLLLGRLLIALAATGLAGTVAAVGVEGLPGAWVVIAASAVVGMGFVVGGPAQQALLPTLVRPSELTAAVALNGLPPTVARAGGPVLGTLLLVAAGPAVAFGFTAVANLVFAWVILRLPLERPAERASKADGTVRAGFAYVRGDVTVALLLTAVLAIGLGADPVVTLTPELSAGFGQGESLVGLFASAFGVGAALGYFGITPITRRSGTDHVLGWGLCLLGGGMLLTGLAPTVAVAVLGLAIAGVGFCWSLTGSTTRIYERVPESLRGRVMALWSIAFLGSRPVGAAISSGVAEVASPEVAFVAVAGIVAVLTAICWAGGRRQPRGA